MEMWYEQIYTILTENGCFSGVVQTNDYDAHLLGAYKPAEQLRKNESHLY